MMVYLLKMVIFHGYVKQPEGIYIYIYRYIVQYKHIYVYILSQMMMWMMCLNFIQLHRDNHHQLQVLHGSLPRAPPSPPNFFLTGAAWQKLKQNIWIIGISWRYSRDIIRKVREPNREPGTEPREPETAQKPAVGKPNRTEPLMYKISSRTGRTGGRNRMRTAGMCSVCFSEANVPFNLCPRIGFVFFGSPTKTINTTLVPSYWICFFWQHQKSKNTTLVPSYWVCFFAAPKKAKP